MLGDSIQGGTGANFIVFAMGELNPTQVLGIDLRNVGFAQDQALVAT
jgi:hypothetical protein